MYEKLTHRTLFTENSRIVHDFWFFLPENAQVLHNNCPKNIFPEFFRGTCPLPPTVCYAYARPPIYR